MKNETKIITSKKNRNIKEIYRLSIIKFFLFLFLFNLLSQKETRIFNYFSSEIKLIIEGKSINFEQYF